MTPLPLWSPASKASANTYRPFNRCSRKHHSFIASMNSKHRLPSKKSWMAAGCGELVVVVVVEMDVVQCQCQGQRQCQRQCCNSDNGSKCENARDSERKQAGLCFVWLPCFKVLRCGNAAGLQRLFSANVLLVMDIEHGAD